MGALLCEVCEQAPASVTCKADAAALCFTCDRDIHSANPLASRHERVPIYDAEEAEAASWLLPNDDNNNHNTSTECKYLDLMLGGDEKMGQGQGRDGVVPVKDENGFYGSGGYGLGPVVDGFPTYEVEYCQQMNNNDKPFLYNFTAQSLSQSVSSSSMDVGVVPDHSAMADVSNAFNKGEIVPAPLTGLDREARVMRYREKRKNRKFEKTIRYASRKAYAETRPRIKGRFAKRGDSHHSTDVSYSVVPTF